MISSVTTKCYKAVETTVTHEEALTACNADGAKLMEPKSIEENSYIFFVTLSHWIGVHDLSAEGRFTFESDDALVTDPYWAHNEPNSLGLGEDCVMKLPRALHNWNDGTCTHLLYYVCEHVV